MEDVQALEKAVIQLRLFAAATLSSEWTGQNIIYTDEAMTISVEISQEGYLSLHLPVVLPNEATKTVSAI